MFEGKGFGCKGSVPYGICEFIFEFTAGAKFPTFWPSLAKLLDICETFL